MSKIIFQVAPVTSHLNSSFVLAKKLIEMGHTITYIGYINYSTEIEELIKSKGYNFYRLIPDDNSSFKAPEFSFLQKVLLTFAKKKKREIFIFIKRLKDFVMNPEWFKKLFQELEPDIFIFDVFEVNYALSLLLAEKKRKIFVFQDKFVTNQDPWVPPLNSSYVPKGLIDKLIIPILWRISYLKQKLSMKSLLGLDTLKIAQEMAKTYGKPIQDKINVNRSFQYEIKGIPELVLSPKELDLPRKSVYGDKFYFGSGTNLSRKDIFYDWCYKNDLQKIMDFKEKEGRRVIYCSLGSISTVLSTPQKCIDFYERVIKACANHSEYVLIISIGKLIDYHYLGNLPDNIFVYQVVPQTEVLSYADLMISHGGTKSIIECVLSEVPVIAFPTNMKWDQAGNTARVVYHKLGLNGSFKRASPAKIKSKIAKVLSTPIYKENMAKMRKEISANPQYLNTKESQDYLAQIVNQ